MSTSRNLTGLTGAGPAPPDRTVGAPPPRRRSPRPGRASEEPRAAVPAPIETAAPPAEEPRRRPRRAAPPRPEIPARSDTNESATTPPTTLRISVNIPLTYRQWLSGQAREQQRFVSEILMEAVDRHGEDASPPSGRAKRVAVPDGTICNNVLPPADRQRIDDLVIRKSTTRSALVTEVLRRASDF